MLLIPEVLLLTLTVSAAKSITSDYILPVYEREPAQRLIATGEQRRGYEYGPPKLGNTSFFPVGPLWNALVLKNLITFGEDNTRISEAATRDAEAALRAITEAGGIKSLGDYGILYEGQWKMSVPAGIDVGTFSNGTSDLLFSMERLSASPFSVRRLHPTKDDLPFAVDPDVVSSLTGFTLDFLHSTGRLFFADHSDQLLLPKTSLFSAACSTYFYIAPTSDEFLPLAIKTNTDADLVYTPLDAEDDWLLAKIMMNSNEVIFNAVFHVAATHAVQEIVHQAALKTLSVNHPVLALLNRLMYTAYAPREVGPIVLTGPGGVFDTFTSVTEAGVEQLIGHYYANGAGRFQANYFVEGLITRGLLNCTYGPPLKRFPFFEDANSIYLPLRRFMTAFVESYYKSSEILILDNEMQDWLVEATEGAQVLDFPEAPTSSREVLIDILTHFAYLSVVHNTLNGGDPVAVTSVLPFHPAALYAPLPLEKGAPSVLKWLPDANASVAEIKLFAEFTGHSLGRRT